MSQQDQAEVNSENSEQSDNTSDSGSTHDDSSIECPVCLNSEADLTNVVIVNPCHHKMHKSCLLRCTSTSNSCPVCRTVIVSYSELNSDGSTSENVTPIRRTNSYPRQDSAAFYHLTQGVVICYIFANDQIYLRSGDQQVEIWRFDKLPSRRQFTIGRDSIVQLYNIIIDQSSYYMICFSEMLFRLDVILESLMNRLDFSPSTGRLGALDHSNESDLDIYTVTL